MTTRDTDPPPFAEGAGYRKGVPSANHRARNPDPEVKVSTSYGRSTKALNAAHTAIVECLDALPLDGARTEADDAAHVALNAALARIRDALRDVDTAARSGVTRQADIEFHSSSAEGFIGKRNGDFVLARHSSLGPGEKLVRKNVRGKILIMVESYGGSFRYPPVINLD